MTIGEYGMTYKQLLEITDSDGKESWINPAFIMRIGPRKSSEDEWEITLCDGQGIIIGEEELEPLLALMVRGKPRELLIRER